ncbi:MAG: hypothetical protein PF495_14505 [Spirochaetales bacterium]|jgi:hypothetical protein|nr:hypothetical protein [Spirochaetales bacterium]
MFKEATKLSLRFKTAKGLATTEDLWDLPLVSQAGPNLDDIYKSLNKEIKDSGEESIIIKRKERNTVLHLKFDIVKAVIEEKMADAEAVANAGAIKARNEKILALIARKEDGKMEELDIADLKKLLQ